jgi:hypothetical protein
MIFCGHTRRVAKVAIRELRSSCAVAISVSSSSVLRKTRREPLLRRSAHWLGFRAQALARSFQTPPSWFCRSTASFSVIFCGGSKSGRAQPPASSASCGFDVFLHEARMTVFP